ncbi:MAG: hypothetical protein GIKADHBN_01003 [Phycisphaerales bacterium]|nr:hypothetical protein [Phycisphaerales bacterium]
MQLWSIHPASPTDGANPLEHLAAEVCSTSGERWARWSTRSVVDPAWTADLAHPDFHGGTWITPTNDPSADPDTPWVRWGSEARAKLAASLERLGPVLVHNAATLLLAPGVGGAVSDVPSIMKLDQDCRRIAPGSLGIVLEPAALLAPSMVGDAADHLARLYALTGLAATVAVVVSNVRPGGSGTETEPTDFDRGLIDAAVLRSCVSDLIAGPAIGGSLKLVVRGDPAKFGAWLAGGGPSG